MFFFQSPNKFLSWEYLTNLSTYSLASSLFLLSILPILTSRSWSPDVDSSQTPSSLSKNPILVTALNPIIGYEKAAEIAKKAYKENRPIIEVAAQETDLSKAKLLKLLDPKKLAKGGI